MLWQQPRIAALGSDVDESKRARGYGREAERRARDLPAAFPMRTVNDKGSAIFLFLAKAARAASIRFSIR
jgi:hypothetical protein